MPLRVLTANLLYDHAHADAFAAILDDLRPDVVALQELGAGVAAVVASRYPNHDLDPRPNPRGMGLAAADGASFERIELPGEDAFVGTLGSGLRIVTAHVANPVDPPLIAANRRRRTQVRALVADVTSSTGPLVVMGDFNASPLWPAYRRFTSLLDDAVVQAVGRRRARRMKTWGPRRIGGRRMLRIDHVFVRGLRGVEARVVPVPGSDHAAVVVDLEEAE